ARTRLDAERRKVQARDRRPEARRIRGFETRLRLRVELVFRDLEIKTRETARNRGRRVDFADLLVANGQLGGGDGGVESGSFDGSLPSRAEIERPAHGLSGGQRQRGQAQLAA